MVMIDESPQHNTVRRQIKSNAARIPTSVCRAAIFMKAITILSHEFYRGAAAAELQPRDA